MQRTFTRRQVLGLLTAAGFGAPFVTSPAQDSRQPAAELAIEAGHNPLGAVPGATSGVSAGAQARHEVLAYLKARGHGSYLFGQVATWVHNENPDVDHSSNWIKKVQEHTGKLPRYGCITMTSTITHSAMQRGMRESRSSGIAG